MADFQQLFEIESVFAACVARLTDAPWERVVADYTTFAHHAGLRHAPESEWREFCAELERAPDPAAFVFRAFEANDRVLGASAAARPAEPGCFSYDVDAETGVVQYHFRNADRSGLSPLSPERVPARVEELTAMFATIKARHPEARTVIVTAWLHNLRSFARLMPPTYLDRTTVDRSRLNGMSIWGQFFDFRGRLARHRADAFLGRVQAASSLDDVANAFPYQRLRAEAPVEIFYAFYGLS